MKNIINAIGWAVQYPHYAVCWLLCRKPYSTVVATIAVALGLTGCTTTGQLDVARIASVSKQAAQDATTDLLAPGVHPDWKPQFQLAANDLTQLASSPNIDLQSILSIVQRLPVTALKGQTAQVSFEGATMLISAIDLPELPADAVADLHPIAQALADGINAGIAANTPPTPTATAPPAATTN